MRRVEKVERIISTTHMTTNHIFSYYSQSALRMGGLL